MRLNQWLDSYPKIRAMIAPDRTRDVHVRLTRREVIEFSADASPAERFCRDEQAQICR